MSTCRHTELSKSARGLVEYCADGGVFRLRFGNAVMQLDMHEIATVLSMVASYDHNGDAAGNCPAEHALIDIGETGASFAFHRDEVTELHLLLSAAVSRMHALPLGTGQHHTARASSHHLN